MRLLSLTLALSTLAPVAAHADEHFRFTRTDSNIPAHCTDFQAEWFPSAYPEILYSIEGAVDRGFTHEYPLNREDAEWLWETFKHGDTASRQSPQATRLQREIEQIEKHKLPMGFDFGSEGEVLELLALNDLNVQYPDATYFRTGGLEYHAAGSSTTIGELDVLVGRRDNCEIVSVGEAKLGVGALGKAKQQLQRFKHFINGMNHARNSRLLFNPFN